MVYSKAAVYTCKPLLYKKKKKERKVYLHSVQESYEKNSCKPGIKYFTSVNCQFTLVNCHFTVICQFTLVNCCNLLVYTCKLPLYCNLPVYKCKLPHYCNPLVYTCKPPLYKRPIAEDNNFSGLICLLCMYALCVSMYLCLLGKNFVKVNIKIKNEISVKTNSKL